MKPLVLIVEDDPDMRALECMALEESGCEVVAAAHGLEALACLDRMEPTIILLDLMMPGMDGLTFLAERRKRGIQMDVPVICVSAASGELIAHAVALGACATVPKPADFDLLSALVAHYASSERPRRPVDRPAAIE